ncbi:putative secondary alcohol dehydrogenase protein [Rosellinia necatrix]|uniref:Putative secondary alcohol dehydrogenase protein n=1 Tax=Rosellinia necatrix TaxID=77044 RepID=A0A1S7UHJ5_ROSNE|nr:putative secondary alcohol dehydrogenase protein [Rosellinia necatrix]
MSSETQPISPARFAEALKDLPASSLALKVLELRNSIAHLDYSNEELKPFAEGTVPTVDQHGNRSEAGQPDQDCKDAIAENEAVIVRMQERIELIRAEVEGRGLSWQEFRGTADQTAAATQDAEEDDDVTRNGISTTVATTTTTTTMMVNGHGQNQSVESQHEAWRDGTFRTGTIRSDEDIIQELLSRMPADHDDEDPDAGMHL